MHGETVSVRIPQRSLVLGDGVESLGSSLSSSNTPTQGILSYECMSRPTSLHFLAEEGKAREVKESLDQ